jgi:transcription antitermination protein NusB
MASRRRLARAAVMQTIFETHFSSEGESRHPVEEILARNIKEHGTQKVDSEFAHALLDGISEREEEILSSVQENAPQWPLERMDDITRSILIVGGYEILFGGDAPPAVVMNEAIEIAKEYGGSESGKFVNGVLNAIEKNKRA